MILPVYLYGQPVLRKEAAEIDSTFTEIVKLIDNMFETMYASEGVGLAAPQIGQSIKLIVIDGSPMGEDFPECKDFKKVFINPEIIEFRGTKVSLEEGCLSLPGIHESVTRPTELTIKYMDENFEEHEEVYTGFAARIIQHEYDHLLGKMFIDHISPIRKQLIKSKLNNIIKGKVRCSYRTKMLSK